MAGQRGKAAAGVRPAADDGAEVDLFGQITLPLGGQDYILRPSFEAITGIEARLGRSLYELATAASHGSLSVSDMGVITEELMHAHGKTLEGAAAIDYQGAKAPKLSRLIYEAGSPAICARLMVVLTGALSGGYTAEGEAKAGTAAKPIPAGT